jgi:hypothetical protein
VFQGASDGGLAPTTPSPCGGFDSQLRCTPLIYPQDTLQVKLHRVFPSHLVWTASSRSESVSPSSSLRQRDSRYTIHAGP